jgi:alpha-methylacyl-CoA racemase
MPGPLHGLKIIEMAGKGSAPFASMLFADMGAQVLRIERPSKSNDSDPRFDPLQRSRRILSLDLRDQDAVATLLRLIEHADALIEGFRPGVMERLGLGPDQCLARNPRLVFARVTGWGQTGPLSHTAGNDINYVALSGALHAIGQSGEAPRIPLNYIGNFGGGGMLIAFGVMCALLETRTSGRGQVVDAAMTDGAALLSTMMYGMKAAGQWSNLRGENLLDGGAHFYGTYACADGKYISIGAIEQKFYAVLRERCGIDDPLFNQQMDSRLWPMLKLRLADVFRTRTRQEWCDILEGTDACFAPVLDWDEAPMHPHNHARETFVTIDNVLQPAPAPRFSRTPADRPRAACLAIDDTDEVLREWGVDIGDGDHRSRLATA